MIQRMELTTLRPESELVDSHLFGRTLTYSEWCDLEAVRFQHVYRGYHVHVKRIWTKKFGKSCQIVRDTKQ